jgi:hypothetical protein
VALLRPDLSAVSRAQRPKRYKGLLALSTRLLRPQTRLAETVNKVDDSSTDRRQILVVGVPATAATAGEFDDKFVEYRSRIALTIHECLLLFTHRNEWQPRSQNIPNPLACVSPIGGSSDQSGGVT